MSTARQPAVQRDPDSQRSALGGDAREVAVVAQDAQGPTDRGVDEAIGRARRGEGDVERGEEERTHVDPVAGRGVDHGELGVVPEPAAHAVDRVDLEREQQARLVSGLAVGHGDHG